MSKNIIVMCTDHTEAYLTTMPSLQQMQQYVGGFIELIRVLPLDAPEVSTKLLTYMVVNEEGRLLNLPRNEEATKIYHNLTLKQFSGAKNPFARAREEFLAMLPKGVEILSTYDGSEPFIAGTAIYFQGYTCAELDALWNEE
jgi:Domain of unknown function (DUF3846)